jgi:hypothetical protein
MTLSVGLFAGAVARLVSVSGAAVGAGCVSGATELVCAVGVRIGADVVVVEVEAQPNPMSAIVAIAAIKMRLEIFFMKMKILVCFALSVMAAQLTDGSASSSSAKIFPAPQFYLSPGQSALANRIGRFGLKNIPAHRVGARLETARVFSRGNFKRGALSVSRIAFGNGRNHPSQSRRPQVPRTKRRRDFSSVMF